MYAKKDLRRRKCACYWSDVILVLKMKQEQNCQGNMALHCFQVFTVISRTRDVLLGLTQKYVCFGKLLTSWVGSRIVYFWCCFISL